MLASKPNTVQLIVAFAGKGGIGVQVKTVLPALQAVVTLKFDGGVPKNGKLDIEFIGPLKVNTTGADTETPVAPFSGLLVTVV
jgi:hypothetical protein